VIRIDIWLDFFSPTCDVKTEAQIPLRADTKIWLSKISVMSLHEYYYADWEKSSSPVYFVFSCAFFLSKDHSIR
jgi:hypothetical protein